MGNIANATGLGRAALAVALRAAGLWAFLVGAQALGAMGLLTALGQLWPPGAHEPILGAAVAAGVGWVLLSGGTVRYREAEAALRPTVSCWAAVVAAGVTVVAIPAALGRMGWALVAATVQVALVAGFTRYVRDRSTTVLTPMSPRTPANLIAMVFLAGSAITVAAGLPDVYPLSRYPMYSAPRLGDYTLQQVRFLEVDEHGDARELSVPVSRNVLVALVQDDDLETLRAIAERAGDRHGAQRVRVVHDHLQVPAHPAPPTVEVASSEEVMTVARR